MKVQIHGNESLVQLGIMPIKIRYCAAIHGKVLHRDCKVDGFCVFHL